MANSNLVHYDISSSSSSSDSDSNEEWTDGDDFLHLQVSQTPVEAGCEKIRSSDHLLPDVTAEDSQVPGSDHLLECESQGSPNSLRLQEELPSAMNKFLKELELYSTETATVNLEHQKVPKTMSTYQKSQEILLCFLAFANSVLGLEMRADLFLRLNVIEQYFTYLKEVRHLTWNTMADHAYALIKPAEFLHMEHSPEFANVEVVKKLRDRVASFQREAHMSTSITSDEVSSIPTSHGARLDSDSDSDDDSQDPQHQQQMESRHQLTVPDAMPDQDMPSDQDPDISDREVPPPADQDPDSDDSDEVVPPTPCSPMRGKYSLPPAELPETLQTFMTKVKRYFLKPVNLERQTAALNRTTYEKAQERMLCYLGFVKKELGLELNADLFQRPKVMEKYLAHLKDARNLSSSTIANHAASLLYPAKFIHRESAPNYSAVPVVTQLRAQVAHFQRKGEKERANKKEDLEAANKWLDWKYIVNTVELQRQRYEMARSRLPKAAECADLVLLSLYILMPPSRGLEIRTLEILDPTLSLGSPLVAGKNLLTVDDSGRVTLIFQNYKTVATYGKDTTILEPDHPVSLILRDYLKNHRSHLLKNGSGQYVFVNKSGSPHTSSSFSAHLKSIFHRLTGVNLSINVLRSSFLTHAYGLSGCTDSMKDSLASALRHSRKHAQGTYDRRTSNERKKMTICLASSIAAESAVQPDGSPSSSQEKTSLEVGDFVGLCETSSTLQHPKVLIGRIQSFLADGEVSLLWYALAENKRDYVFCFHPDPWIESIHALHPVDMRPIKKQPGLFKLHSSLRAIHKAFS